MNIIKSSLCKLINKKFILLSTVLIFFFFSGSAYQNKALSLNFVDEDYNFTLGKYLIEGGKIYDGQFSNHQPLPFILSGVIQKTLEPNSIFLLVKRHREAIIIYSLLCSLLLVLRFGLPLLVFVLIYEQTKIFLLGNLFLPESLVVYPLVYLVTLIFLTDEKMKEFELFLVGLSLGFIIFLLAPLWPLAFFIFLIFLQRSHFHVKKIFIILLGIALPLIVSFLFTSLIGYLHDAIYINLRYFIPLNSTDPFLIGFFKSFSAPIWSLLNYQDNSTLRIIKLSTLTLIFSLLLIYNRFAKTPGFQTGDEGEARFQDSGARSGEALESLKYRKTADSQSAEAYKKRGFKLALISLSLLTLANLRFIEPGNEYYRGFHLLPWYSILILLGVLTGSVVFKLYKSYFIRISIIFMVLLAIGVSTLEASKHLYVKADIAQDLYIHYSPQFSIGEAVRIMKDPSDRLFVAPDEWLIYWQSGLWSPLEINSYYDWMEKVPYLKEQIDKTFNESPPEFFYCNCPETSYLNTYLKKYKAIKKDGKETQLYILPIKLKSLNKIQIENLKFYGFGIE